MAALRYGSGQRAFEKAHGRPGGIVVYWPPGRIVVRWLPGGVVM
jgi:hypothetical protein